MIQDSKLPKLHFLFFSAFVLSSCLPQDEALLSSRDIRNIEAQIQLYARSFQQFQNKSLSQLINSAAWGAQAVPEGVLPELDMGNAGMVLASAYCTDLSGDGYHLTWFDAADESGHVSLKGLGNDQIGQANTKIKSLIPDAQFGVFNGAEITMAQGGVLSLSPGCTINIPTNSAVAAVHLPIPNDITAMDQVAVMRTRACDGTDVEGMIVDTATVGMIGDTTSQTYIYNGGEYDTEAQVIAAISDADWTEMSNNCVIAMPSTVLAAANAQVDMINVAALTGGMGVGGNVINEIERNLSGISCLQVGRGVRDVDDVDGDGNTEEYIINEDDNLEYETCVEAVELDITDQSLIQELDSFETVLPDSLNCPAGTANYAGQGAITMDGTSFFSGVNPTLNGMTGTITTTDVDGALNIEKTIKTFIVSVDHGDGVLDLATLNTGPAENYIRTAYAGGGSPDQATVQDLVCGDHSGCSVQSGVNLVGTAGQCEARQFLNFSCQQMYPGLTLSGGVQPVNNDPNSCREGGREDGELTGSCTATPTTPTTASTGLRYIRTASLNGWHDQIQLVPNDYAGTWVEIQSMSCTFSQTQTTGGCSGEIQQRTWTATAPGQTEAWGPWVTTSSFNNCSNEFHGGGGRDDGGSSMYNDTNGNGVRDAGERGGWNGTRDDNRRN